MTVEFSTNFTKRSYLWTAFKGELLKRKGNLQSEEYDVYYLVWFYDGAEVFLSRVWKTDVPEDILAALGYSNAQAVLDLNDFTIKFLSTSNGTNIKKDDHGSAVFAPTHVNISESWRMEGHKYVADGYATSIFDERILHEVLVQGARYWAYSTNMNSYAEFSVVDKTNTLGLHTLYNLPVGYPIELKKFVKTCRLPSGFISDAIIAPTVSPVVAGLDIRCTVVNNGPDPIHVAVNYAWYEK